MISSLVNRLESNSKREESRNSSLRSASSRYQAGYRPQLSAVSSSYPSSSQSPYSGESPASDISLNEYHEDIDGVEDVLYKCTSLSAASALPPPPTEYELQALRGDEDDKIIDESQLPPAMFNNSYSSLLNSTFNVDMPTPAAARRRPYHPDQHLINHKKNISDLSLASDFVPGSDLQLNHTKSLRNSDVRKKSKNMRKRSENDRKRSEATPSPPQRHDSERLAMSSLSEEEETAFLHDKNTSRKKKSDGRPPLHPNSRGNRLKKKINELQTRPQAQHKDYYYQPSKISSQNQIYLDTSGTTEV